MTTNAHKFTAAQIENIAKHLGVATEAVKSLEEGENLEVEVEVQGSKEALLIYVSIDADTGIVTVDVFLDDNSLDNEEAYKESIQSDAKAVNLEASIEAVMKEFTEKYMSKT